MSALVQRQSTDPRLQGSLCRLLCQPSSHWNGQKWNWSLRGSVSVCFTAKAWMTTLFFCEPDVPTLKIWFRIHAVVMKHKVLLSEDSQFSWKLVGYSRDVHLHIEPAYEPKVHKKGGGRHKDGVKGFIHNTLVLTGLQLRVQLQIHIRGLSLINEPWDKPPLGRSGGRQDQAAG